MAKDNLTAVLYGINDIRLEQRPIPVPKENQVLLAMDVVGICGSDVHYLVNGKIGPFVLQNPMVIGHEAAGTVVQCGKGVTNLKPGDKVAIEPGISCRMCSYCKGGSYHLCPALTFCATPPDDGNLTRFYVHDADFCHKLPSNMDLEEGALMEPLSVGVHACKRADVRIGSVCLVLGAGPIGLVTLLSAKAMGASKVIITDIVQHRLDLAKQLGADQTILIEKGITPDQLVAKVKQMLGEEPNISFDCTGQEDCVRTAICATKSGGVVVLIGMGKFEMTIPLAAALTREVDIRGVFRYCNDYPTAIEMVKTGKVNVKPLITHHYRIEETEAAFEMAKSGKGNPVKILIHANPNWASS